MSTRAHFSIAGIPVRIEPVFVVVAVLFGFGLDPLWLLLAWVVVVFVSILVHELGHALTLKAFGQPSSIVLHAFGGVTVSSRRLSRGRSILVSLAGSVTALVLLGVPALVALDTDWAREREFAWNAVDSDFNWWPVLTMVAFANVVWSLANLLPIRPLDGGNIATDLFGIDIARKLSVAVAGAGALWGFTSGNTYVGFFAVMLGLINFSELRAERQGRAATAAFDFDAPDAGRPGPSRRRRPPLRAVPPPPGWTPGRGPGLGGSASGPTLGDAESRAWQALRNGDTAAAARALGPHAQDAGFNPFLRASVVLVSGRADLADQLFERAYTESPGGPPNLVPASLLADHGRAVPVAQRLLDGGANEAAGSLQTHLHYADRFREAAEVGELLYSAGAPSRAQTAFEVACSWARAGAADEAVRWVEVAIDEGFTAARMLDGEPDLADARAHPGWPAVRARLDG
jgi:stage IV sporulation protein FB